MSTSGVTTTVLSNTTARGSALCTDMRNTIGFAAFFLKRHSLPPGTDGSHNGTENAPVPSSSSACESSTDLVLNQVTDKLVSALSTILTTEIEYLCRVISNGQDMKTSCFARLTRKGVHFNGGDFAFVPSCW
ncbi:uncharacterized protein LOC123689960 isoform X1 [Pieris rapae]|uniref:uncharacterized protein LOC123689468 isoform X1 n=1 Tax=Pieris rapae TaxID=64459 RepID=UPI001E27C6B5|nr:uncharacterized protein LOC123689468 isoform X1 [Pieris rapae]XP_045488094.1 uncharacterized protein LOC123689960 isoform X1 [Pieris rapae]